MTSEPIHFETILFHQKPLRKNILYDKNVVTIMYFFLYPRRAMNHLVEFNCKKHETGECSLLHRKKMLAKLQKKGVKLQHGDLISMMGKDYSQPSKICNSHDCYECAGYYRNDDLYIYNKITDKIMKLNYNIDEYGSLPQKFRIFEPHQKGFIIPKTYWHHARHRSIVHNWIVWFDDTIYRKELAENVTYSHFPLVLKDKKSKKIVWTSCKSIYDDSTIYINFDNYLFGKNQRSFKPEFLISIAKVNFSKKYDKKRYYEIDGQDNQNFIDASHPNVLMLCNKIEEQDLEEMGIDLTSNLLKSQQIFEY